MKNIGYWIKNSRRKYLLLGLFITLLIIPTSIVLAINQSSISKTSTIIDLEVLHKLEEQKEVTVIVTLRDNNTYPYRNTKEERLQIYQEIRKKAGEIQLEVLSTLSESDFKIEEKPLGSRWFSGKITKRGLDKLRNNPSVLRVSIPLEMTIALTESIPLINADDVWTLGYAGEGETICVIDSGVDDSHPDLNGKIIAEYCYCNVTDYGSGGCCPDNTAEDDDASDDTGHGTHVAGIAAANGNLKGVAYGAKIVAIKVTNSTGGVDETDIAKGIKWCNDHKEDYNISVITISLTTKTLYNNSIDCDTLPAGDEIAISHDNLGIFVLAASGNNGSVIGIAYPACASGATSVGAVYDADVGPKPWNSVPPCMDNPTSADMIVCFTNRNEMLDLLAPGAVINSTKINGGYEERSGTSQAAPHVAGAAAILHQFNNSLTPKIIERLLEMSGKPIYDSGTELTFQRIDVQEAVELANKSHLWRMVNVSNDGNGILNITAVNSTQNWIKAYPTRLKVPVGSWDEVLVYANSSGMSEGVYQGNVSFYSNDPDGIMEEVGGIR